MTNAAYAKLCAETDDPQSYAPLGQTAEAVSVEGRKTETNR